MSRHVATWPSASTRLVALLGDPVEHSLSPRLHNAVFRSAGLDLVYVALPVAADDLGGVLGALGAVGAAGANVTVPHKLAVHAACDVLTDEAQVLGAVNTVWWRDGALHGTNTDATGLARVLRTTVEDLPGASAVVLGTGGAARAAVAALGRSGADPVVVVGRRAAALRDVVAVARAAGGGQCTGVLLDDDTAVGDAVRAARVVVNATPLGMGGERLPPSFHALVPGQVAHDLVYGRATTPFLHDAWARGADGHDGTAMLVAQAEDAYAVWTGRVPPAGGYAAAMAG